MLANTLSLDEEEAVQAELKAMQEEAVCWPLLSSSYVTLIFHHRQSQLVTRNPRSLWNCPMLPTTSLLWRVLDEKKYLQKRRERRLRWPHRRICTTIRYIMSFALYSYLFHCFVDLVYGKTLELPINTHTKVYNYI